MTDIPVRHICLAFHTSPQIPDVRSENDEGVLRLRLPQRSKTVCLSAQEAPIQWSWQQHPGSSGAQWTDFRSPNPRANRRSDGEAGYAVCSVPAVVGHQMVVFQLP